MAGKVRLSADQIEELESACRCTTRPGTHTQLLASLGLVINGHGRFGGWVKATEFGKQYIDGLSIRGGRAASTRGTGDTVRKSSTPVGTPGPPQGGYLLRGAAPRKRAAAATNARARAAIPPPAAAQDVGAPIKKPRKRHAA